MSFALGRSSPDLPLSAAASASLPSPRLLVRGAGVCAASPLRVSSGHLVCDWNAKVGSQETPGITGKFGLGARNEAGQRLIEFCQENALVIANTLFQQHKRGLYTWTSPDGQHRNQIDYILCNQRWRSCIQLAKTRPGADCGSDHELLIAKFRLKLKKAGKTTRPFRYDLNQIPYDYTVEVRNRFKGLDLIDRVPDELWTEVRDIVQETGTKTIPMEKKCRRAKWLSEEALQIAVKRREAKSKGEKERYKHLNAEFQRIARRDKKDFLSDQCKEIEENNRIGKTRDLFKKIRDSKGTFHAKMGSIKDRNGMDLIEAEDIKKRWQEYREELYKTDLHDQDSHDNVITDLEPDILECEFPGQGIESMPSGVKTWSPNHCSTRELPIIENLKQQQSIKPSVGPF
ncbi:uncharacterized protein LOC129553083 [Moschus berezovskii]|uniref:uncharacterized protein LOC129553083 n=1 Tax=Moschus berezovskii TaxID=68408 RepID=UPI00244535D9|nr:uncharacterized protein LOC129553083 [Moschus berezovskii]